MKSTKLNANARVQNLPAQHIGLSYVAALKHFPNKHTFECQISAFKI